MSNKQFISNLSATYADVRKLDAKKINLKGKNILEYIEENKTIIFDERGTQADDQLDIWNSYVTKDVDGNVFINKNTKPFEHSSDSISSTQFTTISLAVKVIDNEVLGANDAHLMYWQTDGMTSGRVMFYNCSALTSFSSDLSSLTSGSQMFQSCSNLTSFNGDLSSLTNGYQMFKYCSNLISFNSDLPSLTGGAGMFYNCYNLKSFSSDLSSLTDAEQMFELCTALTSFNSDLPSLTMGKSMFGGCFALTSFTSDLPTLTDSELMFYNCTALTSFNSDLSSLTNGKNMFFDCTSLTSFCGDLSSLTDGTQMFWNCKLNAQSVSNIIHFLPTHESNGIIYIGVDITNTDAAKQAFAAECCCNDWEELNKEFDDKNWGVYWAFNGPASYSLRDPRPSTAVYAKLEEVILPTEEEIAAAKENGERIQIPRYQYTSQDGSKFYNIHWYHDSNTDNEGYDYFESLEMATLAYSVISKE